MDIMVEAGYGSDQSEFYVPLYYPLYIKLQTVQSESNIREHEVISCHAMYEDINSYMTTIKKELNFETYLGLQLYKEFCLYRKEDTYSNDNYTSDGLNNVEILEKAKEFLDVAKKEVIKSGTPQHSISTTLDNLFSIAEFAPIRNKMQLGNFIRVRIGNNLYRLRLVSINGQSSDTNSISVTFSDVINVNGIMSDVQDILSSAKSMATSYNYVAQQASKGEEANNTFSDFIKNGLTSALTTISNNNHEEVALTEQGLWCREYDDVTDSYSPKQFRATHNILAYTDDNWVTSRAALGEHEYYYIYYDDSDKKHEGKNIGYGLTADAVTAGIVNGCNVYGSQIVSGKIYSTNYTGNSGVKIDLDNEEVYFGNSLVYKDKKLQLGSDISITWGQVSDRPTNVSQFNNDSGYQNASQVTTITEDTIKTTNIVAQNLHVNSANIDGQLSASQINTSGLIAENISSATITGKTINGGTIIGTIINNGNGTFSVNDSGYLSSSSGIIGGWNINSTDLYTGNTGMSSSDGKFAIWAGESNGKYGTSESNAVFKVGHNGALYASNAHISGEITATSGTIGGCSISNNLLQIDAGRIISGTINADRINVDNLFAKTSVHSAALSSSAIYAGEYYLCNATSYGGTVQLVKKAVKDTSGNTIYVLGWS